MLSLFFIFDISYLSGRYYLTMQPCDYHYSYFYLSKFLHKQSNIYPKYIRQHIYTYIFAKKNIRFVSVHLGQIKFSVALTATFRAIIVVFSLLTYM